MDLIINEDNLKLDEVEQHRKKVRAILVDGENKMLVAKYDGLILFPGGKIEKGETKSSAIIREIKEEVGKEYKEDELQVFKTLHYYQKNYPQFDGKIQNRLVQTTYFIGNFRGVSEEGQQLTENEKNGDFRLELISFEKIYETIQRTLSNNPRNTYFQKEMIIILKKYIESLYKHNKVKSLQYLSKKW